ncbi:DUF1932 domain-containing protein [Salibacterium halotolerans]|uniref:3-hydroxyisobutyrate dehydrogenase n=1 Tax=Salibacterium halotolerans TaxID=1884432 RepID=A0A1I5PCX9_9BACI|nr:DUF1932 domain-containing protein [Salibacterium halotolerans]SFP31371.1 3-hydroxyisobutyrate dehydrogenase [Salibacterium halotolerans]
MNIGFIGFGEVGYEMSKGFNSGDTHHIFVYDPLYEKQETMDRAEKALVSLYSNPALVAQENLDVLFVAVPAPFAEEAWQAVLPYAAGNTFYVDLSTAGAETKQKVNSKMEEKGIETFLDGAIMGPLKQSRHEVPIKISGGEAGAFVEWSRPLGMNATSVSSVPGDATNIKFIRSIFTKGLSTLLHEVMEIAEKINLEDTMLASISQTMNKEPFEDIMNRLITGNVQHAERRVKEMENVIDLIQSYDQQPLMTEATRNKLQALTEENLKDYFNGEAPKDWKSVVKAVNHRE